MQQLAAAAYVLPDRIGNVVEIAEAGFELEVGGKLPGFVLIEDRRCPALRIRGADLGRVPRHLLLLGVENRIRRRRRPTAIGKVGKGREEW
jgi:hypothetical protein